MMESWKENERPEALLLSLISRGDTEAFDELYRRWSPMLFGLVLKILNDPRDAEDALQDGFLHIWRKAGSYDAARSSPSTWAYMIFRNKAIDRIRSRDRRGAGVEKIAANEQIQHEDGISPAREAGAREDRQMLDTTLKSIPAEQREAIQLAFFGGLTQVEIAERLKIPLGTVKARIRRGLMKLAEILEDKL